MLKFIKWTFIIVLSLVVVFFVAFKILTAQTKKHSPEQTEILKVNDLELSVHYSQPSKKDRVIFGELVPYGEVWRTGANEPTTFTTNKTISFGGKNVEPGTYSLWTIPEKDAWTVILNNGDYGWGVAWGGVASRLPEHDVASVIVPTAATNGVVEKLMIGFTENPLEMHIKWDNTQVAVGIE